MLSLPSKIFGIAVEQKPIGRPGGKPLLAMPATGKGVLHTTEGWNMQAAWTTLAAKHAAPHFLVGEGRIMQLRPIGVQAAALLDTPLHPNKDAAVQVEMCGYTGGNSEWQEHATDKWQLATSTLQPMAALLAYLGQQSIVPLARAYPWPDDCSDIHGIWATASNSRRKSNLYFRPELRGWFYHLEVPGNSHYDCGAMDFHQLVIAAQALLT